MKNYRNLLLIFLTTILLITQIPLAEASTNCSNRAIVERQCSSPSFCDRLWPDGSYTPEPDEPDSYCGNYGRIEGRCIEGEGMKDNHYHEGWYMGLWEWHISVCESEGHPCEQSDCYQTMWDVLLGDVYVPGCWDPENEGDYADEVNTDCIVHVSTSCACIQNDAGTGNDAGDTFDSATSKGSGSYTGKLLQAYDTDDWYQFYASSGQTIYVSMTPPAGVDFDLELYNPSGDFKAGSYAGAGSTDSVSYTADSSGYWRTRIYIYSGEGQYSFEVSVTGGGGGGGCPYVSTWDGEQYVLDNNLLAASEASGRTDVTDYYMLQQMLAQREDGTYSLLLSEFENEHSFFDYAQLVAVDHPSDVNVAVSPYGEILTYTEPSPPVSAISNENRNVKHLLNAIDGNYYEGYNGSYITLNFGDELDVSQGAKLVMRADAPVYKLSIHIQVEDSDGNWNTVATVIPRVNWATEIVDMPKHLPDAKDNLKVRLYFTANHKVDFVGLDTSPQATIDIHEAQLTSAIHSTDGDVTTKLLYSDETYAELIPGQNIELIFALPDQTMEARNYIIITEGRYYTIET